MEYISSLANEFWNLWLFGLFAAAVIWALWPSKRRKKQMEDAANIPLLDDEVRTKLGPKS